MRIMIAGGGTGGHVFPGVAVAKALCRRVPATEIRWVGTAHGLEGRMGAALGYPLETLPLAPLKGRGLAAKVRALWQAGRSCGQARRLLQAFRPDLVVGVGGYVAGPVTLMAALRGCPTLLLEQNRIAGLTNRLLGRVARRICTTYSDSARFFPRRKVVCTGNPIRRQVIEDFTRAAPRQDTDFVLLVFGGSQGARAIDTAVMEALPHLASHQIRVIHQYGKGTDRNTLAQRYAAAGIRAELHPFIEAIGTAYAQVDLVLCRGGASSLTELTLVGRPAIVVPYPHAADDHQVWNARFFGDAGAVVVCEERALTGEWLATEIARCVREPARLAAMAQALRRLARPDAAENIVQECLNLVRGSMCDVPGATSNIEHRT